MKRNITNNKRLSVLPILFPVISFAGIILLLVSVYSGDRTKVVEKRSGSGFSQVEDVVCMQSEDKDAPAGIRQEYRFSLAEQIKRDTNLAFYTVHQYVTVEINGKEVYRLKPDGKHRISKTVGCNWVMIPLYREDAGAKVCVVITPAYTSIESRKVDFYIGSRLAIYSDRLKKDLPQLVLGIMAVFLGIIFLGMSVYCILARRPGKRLAALGLFAVMLGIWRLMDTRFTPLILLERPAFTFYLSIAMLCFGMIPLFIWAEEYFNKAVQKVFRVYCVASSMLCIGQVVCQLAGILDIREMLRLIHFNIGVGILVIVGSILYEHIRYPKEKKRILGNIFPVACAVGAMGDIILYYIRGNSSGLVFSLLAFLLYLVFVGIYTVFQYSDQKLELARKDRLLAEQERKLTQTRISTMMSQIRSHFIFNVLAAISGYCKIDPEKADNALIRFSRYLRKNIRIIEVEGLIDFDEELEQLEDYVALEQLRFEDMIVFEKEIETSSFKIPPLTIQPLVENAIKHGLVGQDRSGIIRLHTARKGDRIEITVTDNGVGFVPEEMDKKESVGLRNVRYRLETMIGGSLSVRSRLGEGTTVLITIPV